MLGAIGVRPAQLGLEERAAGPRADLLQYDGKQERGGEHVAVLVLTQQLPSQHRTRSGALLLDVGV